MNVSMLLLLIAAASATFGLGALCVALVRRAQMSRTASAVDTSVPLPRRALLIRPCAGDESKLLECLISPLSANIDFPIQIVLGVTDASDPAVAVARHAAGALRTAGIETAIVVAPLIGPNRKAAILTEGVRRFGQNCDVVIAADSNVDLTGVDLNTLTRSLCARENPGAVWMPFRETTNHPAFGNTASEAVLHFSWHAFGLLAAVDPRGMVGKLFAVQKSALDAIGGFRSTAGVLGEDMALACALRSAGRTVRFFPKTVTSASGTKTWADTLARHVRWMMVIKGQRPALLLTYPALFFNSLLIYGAAMIALPVYPASAAGLIAGTLLIRLAVGWAASQASGVRVNVQILFTRVFIADFLLLVAFVKTLFTRTFTWRGRALTVARSGELRDVA